MPRNTSIALLAAALCVPALALAADPPAWTFDPNALRLTNDHITAFFRPIGDMHGLIIEKMGDAPSPVAPKRAFLNLEHYLETGRWAEYLPRRLEHTAVLDRKHLTIQFPQPPDWPVRSQLTYTFTHPDAIDARLDFAFSDKLRQFEVYFTSYVAAAYERAIRVNGKWMRPEISPSEQLLIPRDEKIAARFEDGRWNFLKGRIRLADYRFDLPVMVSKDDATGWTLVQLIEPGACTHIAPNRFALGHNFIIGGWDVNKGDQRSARLRLLIGKNLSDADIEKAWQSFAEECTNK